MSGSGGCKCKKSKCLKMYCECFAAGLLCNDTCKCLECANDNNHLEARKQAIEETLRKNSKAFEPKITHDADGNAKVCCGRCVVLCCVHPGEVHPVVCTDDCACQNGAKHNRGCRCKKSHCLKRYCECFQASVKCSSVCRCSLIQP